MLGAMRTASAGMKAQDGLIQVIANNLSNVNTVGFKKSEVGFQDLLYQIIKEPGDEVDEENRRPTGIDIGCGTKIESTARIFSQGKVKQTGNKLDLMIEGDGFFQIQNAIGEESILYTRDGSFKMSEDGTIVTSSGYKLYPEIIIPEDAIDIVIQKNGEVYCTTVDNQDEPEYLGEIILARFINPQGLKAIGGNLYEKTSASGDPIEELPGINGLGTIAQGYLETANVEVVDEMVNMIIAQRAYEIMAKVIQTSDEMLNIVNRLVR